ncbi:MAG: membrane protein insertion efficiency factor YidD [Holosporales bacterium]|jgi:putative membrane protein insertion efficiency factor|nr:membrane protein insertion efficiency factor YidD [Holosporales bacterium]
MCRKFLVWCIRLYQALTVNKKPCCRYIPTCSVYAIEAIQKYGVVKGGGLACRRVVRCNPFLGRDKNCGYDPVP